MQSSTAALHKCREVWGSGALSSRGSEHSISPTWRTASSVRPDAAREEQQQQPQRGKEDAEPSCFVLGRGSALSALHAHPWSRHGAETWLCASLVRGNPDECTWCQVRSSRGSFLERMDEGQQRTRLDLATVPTGRPCAGGEHFRAEQPYPMCLLHLGHCSPASACQAAAGGMGRAFPSFDGSLSTGTGRQ